MKEIRIHARAGQGAITTAQILGEAYFLRDIYAYAFPNFGAARMGAPMNAFLRVDNKPVRLRCQIYQPDYVIIIDGTLMRGINCLAGLKEDGVVIINEVAGITAPQPRLKQKVFVVPANRIALDTIGRALGNTALVGAYAAATGEIDLDALEQVVKTRFSGKIQEGNLKAVRQGFEFIKNSKK